MTLFCPLTDVPCCKSPQVHNATILSLIADYIRLVAFDLTMLVQLSGKERSESMWRNLVSQVGGLSVKKFWLAPEAEGTGFWEDIVEVVRDS